MNAHSIFFLKVQCMAKLAPSCSENHSLIRMFVSDSNIVVSGQITFCSPHMIAQHGLRREVCTAHAVMRAEHVSQLLARACRYIGFDCVVFHVCAALKPFASHSVQVSCLVARAHISTRAVKSTAPPLFSHSHDGPNSREDWRASERGSTPAVF